MDSDWKRNNDEFGDRKSIVEVFENLNETTADGGRRRSSSIEIFEDMDCEAADNYSAHRFNPLANAGSNASDDKIFPHKQTHKSIVSASFNPYDNDEPENNSQPGANRTLFNSDMLDPTELQSEATGFDASRTVGLDADAALALKLQQEEYARESLAPYGRRRFPFGIPYGPDLLNENSANFISALTSNDEMMARQMYREEQRNRNRDRDRDRDRVRPPRAYAPSQMEPQGFSRREAAVASQTSDDDRPEILNMPTFLRFPHRREFCDDEDEDSDGSGMVYPSMFRMGHLPGPGPMGLQIIRPFPSRYRRRGGGGLQETEDDFGPEDYERLLQLDDSIKKKQLTSHQINKIKSEKFTRPPNNTDEENLCSICLERFEVNETLRRYPCSHLFHQTCSDRWLKENNVCPICRKPPVDVSTRSNSHSRRPPPNSHERPNQHRSSQNRNPNGRLPPGAAANNRWPKNSHQS